MCEGRYYVAVMNSNKQFKGFSSGVTPEEAVNKVRTYGKLFKGYGKVFKCGKYKSMGSYYSRGFE